MTKNIGQIINLKLHLNAFHVFTNHTKNEINSWLANKSIHHYAWVWPKFLNHNCISMEMKLIEINPDLFKGSDDGSIHLRCVMDDVLMSKSKDFYQSCITMLKNPTYLTSDIHDINQLFIRPIFASDIKEISYEVDEWYADKVCKYKEFQDTLSKL